MNRILQADLILTLTTYQARVVACALQLARERASSEGFFLELDEACKLFAEQCAKQGVQL